MSQPVITAQSLVRYMEARRPAQRAQILRDHQGDLGKKHFAPYYQRAVVAIRRHHSGLPDALSTTIEDLRRLLHEANLRLRTASADDRSKIRSEISKIGNNLRVCSDYRSHFANRDVTHLLKRFRALEISGVRVSGEPTLLGEITSQRAHTACSIVVDPHGEPPTDDAAAYHLEILHALAAGDKATIPPRGFQLWHPSSGKYWQMKRPSVTRWKDISSACTEIASVWNLLAGNE